MAFKTIASFEVLAQPLAPVPNVPFVQQGAFLQVSNLETTEKTINIEYVATPNFVATSGDITLFSNVITEVGLASATSYNIATFLTPPVGFKAQRIPGRCTYLFGVQYLLNPGAVPPANGVDSRGFLRIEAPVGAKLLVLATTRQVFTNFTPGAPGTVLDIAESAYPVPLVGGPEISF